MKTKFLVCLLIATAVASHAAQISWGLTGPVKFDNVSVGANATFSLVCLYGVTDTWDTYAKKVAAGDTTEGVVKTKTTNNSGVSASTASPWAFEWNTTTTPASGKIADGTKFGMLVTTVQDGKTYYWASDEYTVSASDADHWDSTALKYTISQTAASGPNSSWTAVPEPSTAALALAGLALLLKRRKA